MEVGELSFHHALLLLVQHKPIMWTEAALAQGVSDFKILLLVCFFKWALNYSWKQPTFKTNGQKLNPESLFPQTKQQRSVLQHSGTETYYPIAIAVTRNHKVIPVHSYNESEVKEKILVTLGLVSLIVLKGHVLMFFVKCRWH